MTPSLTPTLQDLASNPANASLLASPARQVSLAPQTPGAPMLKNLIGDQTPMQAPAPIDGSGMGGGALPSLPGTLRPLVTNPRQQYEDMLQQRAYAMPDPQKPGFWHELGHIAEKIGTTALGVLAPGEVEKIPGTAEYKQAQSLRAMQMLNGMRTQDETLQNDASKRGLESAQTANATADAAKTNQELANPQDWSAPIPTDQGYMERNHKTGEYRPAMFNGQALKPYEKPLNNENAQPLTNASSYQAALNDRFQILNPGKPLPPEFALPPSATVGDYARVNAALSGLEQAQGQAQNHQDQMANAAATRAAAASSRDDKQDASVRQAAFKAFTPAMDSGERFNVMAQNYLDAAKNHDQQAMLSLLANHLGMTMGLQKGARLNKDIIQDAVKSQPYLQGMASHFDKNGYLDGVTLSVPQMQQMVGLGRDRFSQDVTKARSESSYLGAKDDGPDRVPNTATIHFYMAQTNGDVNKAKDLAKQDGWTVK